MALTRVSDFEDRDVDLAAFAKALSHPARLWILTILAQKRECICGELVSDLPLAQSTVSQHLKALRDIGLIRGTIDGPKSRYCIDWHVLERHQKAFSKWSDQVMKFRMDHPC